ncbi:MAG TPA: protein kinase [Kofleriaceae bacterium]|nr:protein kinase [Kofleriaceae bacterium]
MAGNPTVDELVAAGRYADAARAAEEGGDPARAASLYERIWDFRAAARAARAAGDHTRALRAAIDARDEALVLEIGAHLRERGDDARRAALEVFAGKRRFAEAAAAAEELGDRERAAQHYLAAHRDLDAARVLADLGRDREAGRLYERVIEQGADPEESAAAHLALGRLLARRLQHEPAVRHLQEAARRPATRAAAQHALVVELAALGLRDSARDVLLDARAADPSLPVALDDHLRAATVAADLAPPPADLIAGRYRLDKLLGHGATGRVHRATDEVTGRIVAVKLLAGGHARGSPPYERFVREAGIASALVHPNVIEVHDFSADTGYLVMEFAASGSLDARMERRLGEAVVRRLAADVLAGLEAAHRRGVIHRDIKPANIFFDARGTAKIGDFGVAHLLDLGQTQTGGLIGTLAYMSPEQITGAPLTIAADLYSFGVTLYECLTGRLPFLGPDFVAQHLGDTPPPVAEVAADVSTGWQPILDLLLAKDPSARYQATADLRRDLVALEGDAAAHPRPLVLGRSAPTSAAESSRAMPAVDGAAEEVGPRYRFETPLGRTEVSALSRAVDSALDRSVIVERYDEGGLDAATERRLHAFSKSGGAFLQRVLAFDRTGAVVVYEAPAGMPIGELPADPPFLPLRAARILRRLARALAPLHEAGIAHGAIGPGTVVVDDLDYPTVLVSGLGRAAPGATAAADVAALAGLVGRLVGVTSDERPPLEALLDVLASTLGRPQRAELRGRPSGGSGEELFGLADALEISLLRAARQERKAG